MECFHGCARGGIWIWKGHCPSREISVESYLLERVDDRGHLRVTTAHRPLVTVNEVHVADTVTGFHDRARDRRLLYVHVKEIGQQNDVLRVQGAQEHRGLRQPIEQVRLLSIQHGVLQGHALVLRVCTERLQGFPQPLQRLVPADVFCGRTLDGPNRCRSAESGPEIDSRFDVAARFRARDGIGIGERKLS